MPSHVVLVEGFQFCSPEIGRTATENTARKREEQKAGFHVNPIDQGCIPLLEPLVHRGNESFQDVNAWLTAEQKKGRPGN